MEKAIKKQISIRQAKASDLDDLIEIFLDAIKNIASKDYTPEQIRSWAQVDRAAWAAKRSSRPTWIAEVDGVPAGWIDLDSDGYLDMLFVHSAFQRIGVAKSLLEIVETAGRSQNLKRIFTEASLTAKPVFERHGYKVIVKQIVSIRGSQLTNFRMEKLLD